MAVSYGYDRTRPRTRVTLDSSNLGSANVASEKPLILLGSATGGQPHAPQEVTDFSQASNIFRGGELLDAIEMAWNPSPNVENKAGRIFAVRTDEAKQANLTEGAITVVSNLYGYDANSIQVSYGDNELTGSKRFSVFFTQDRYERVYDNIGNIFSVTYTGDQPQATVTIKEDTNTNQATQLVLSVGEGTDSMQPVRTYELGEGVYKDTNILVNDINNLPDFEASMNFRGGSKNVPTNTLDPMEATDITGGEVTVTAVAGDLVRQTRNDRYISIEIDPTKEMPDTIPLSNLSGAETSPSPASWASIFDTVSDLGAYYIVPLTDDEAIHGELVQFLRDESRNGNHLRGVVGGGFESSVNELVSRQTNLSSSRVSLVGDSVTRRMSDGRVYNAPAYMYAAALAGIASGLPIGEPITYKHTSIEAIDRKFSGSQLDQLDDSGVIMTEFVRTRNNSYYRIVSDPTTYNASSEPVQNTMSLGEVSDFLTTDIRTMLDENFIGSRVQSTSASILKNAVESLLDQQKNVGGLIVDYSPEDVQVVINGDTARINITVQPAQGLSYINVHINYEDNELVG